MTSPSERTPLPHFAAALTFLTGAFVTWTHARWVARGVWDWPMVLGGLVISAGAIACVRRRPSLTAVIAMQGMLFAVLFSQSFMVGFRSLAFGLQSASEALVASLLAFTALATSLPLLAPGRTESMFSPVRYRRFFLLGAIASAASAAIELTGAQYFLRWGIIYGRPDWLLQGCVLGSMGFIQAAAIVGLLRMRGIALLGGLAASAIGGVWTATTGHFTLIPHIGCAVVASIAWTIPLLLRGPDADTQGTRNTRVQAIEEGADSVVELEAPEVATSELRAS